MRSANTNKDDREPDRPSLHAFLDATRRRKFRTSVRPLHGVSDVGRFMMLAGLAGGVEESHGGEGGLGGDGGCGPFADGGGELFPDLGFGEAGTGARERARG